MKLATFHCGQRRGAVLPPVVDGTGALRRDEFRESMPLVPRGERAFTLVEIALSLAVVAFALVAILGVLPTGLRVQKDNREETIINADGAYLLEALRSGQDRLDYLSNSVYLVTINFKNGTRRTIPNDWPPGDPRRLSGHSLLGLLGTPKAVGPGGVSNVVAWIRGVSGSAIDRDPDARDVAFRYQAILETQAFLGHPPATTNLLATNDLARVNQLQSSLHEIRLTMRWPLFRDNVTAPQNARVGSRRRNFRTVVAGSQFYYPTNLANDDRMVFYFQPSLY